MVDRWLFLRALSKSRALEIHRGGSCGPFQQSSTDTSARADVYISPGIMRVGARWCDGPQRSTLDHTPQAVGMATPFAREQEPSKNRRTRPPPCRGEALRYGQRASPSSQDTSDGDNVLQDLPTRRSRTRQLLTSWKLSSWVEVYSSDSGQPLPWPLGSRASAVAPLEWPVLSWVLLVEKEVLLTRRAHCLCRISLGVSLP